MSWLGQVGIEKFHSSPFFVCTCYLLPFSIPRHTSPCLSTESYINKKISTACFRPIHWIHHQQSQSWTETDRERADTVWIDISKLLPSYSWVRHTVGIQASRLHVISSITLLLYACMGLNTISCHHKAEGGPLGLTTAFNGRCVTLSLFSIEVSRSHPDITLLCRSDRPDAETTLTTDRNPSPLRNSNPRPLQANGRRLIT